MADPIPSRTQEDVSTTSTVVTEAAQPPSVSYKMYATCKSRLYAKCANLKIDRIHKLTKSNNKSLTTESANNVSFPLQGVRILDLSRIVAGPFCTMTLGDLGADIIKIEKPGVGDEARKWGPPFIENNGVKESVYFLCLNRNKRSICVDLKTEKGKNIIRELSKKSDVLVENYVPGKLEELQLGYQDLKKISPHLIYCSITGYGSVGQYKNKPGYDVIAASIGGLLHITGEQNGAPVKVGVAATDMATGLYAHGAILAALFLRNFTGEGQNIDCNLFSTQIATLINVGANFLNAGIEGKRWGTAHESIVPYQAFSTKDGYFTIGAGSDKQFVDFCKRLGRQDLSCNEEFLTNGARVKNREKLISILSSILSSKNNKEWEICFQNASFPHGPVNSIKETFDDPHIKEIGLVQTVTHPKIGTIKMVGPPVTYSKGGNKIKSPPPLLGEHTNEVLETILGYDKNEIDKLKKEKVIQ